MMATSQNMVLSASGVSLASSAAGPTEKLTPTITSRTTENTRMMKVMTLPIYSPTTSEIDLPSLRSLIMPDRKSCTPPPKMVPKTIHK